MAAEVQRLRAALKPFADAADRWETRPGHLNTAKDSWQLGDDVAYLTVGDLKRARAALHNAPISKRDELDSLEKLSAEIDTRMQALRSEIEQADV